MRSVLELPILGVAYQNPDVRIFPPKMSNECDVRLQLFESQKILVLRFTPETGLIEVGPPAQCFRSERVERTLQGSAGGIVNHNHARLDLESRKLRRSVLLFVVPAVVQLGVLLDELNPRLREVDLEAVVDFRRCYDLRRPTGTQRCEA